MSEAFILQSRKHEQKKNRLNRILWIIIIFLVFLIIIELAVQLIIFPRLVIKHINVVSELDISREKLLSIAGISENEYYFAVDEVMIKERLESYAGIREAVVEKLFPDTLSIVLKKRIPLAISIGEDNGYTVPVVFDENGVVFQIGDSISEWDLPVVSGLKFKPLIGMKFPERLSNFLNDVYILKTESPEIFRLISEIKVISVNEINYELIVYPVNYNIGLNLGNVINSDILKYAFMVLKLISGPEKLYINLRRAFDWLLMI
jgi:hypothetical protein